jgi:Fe-S cluster biosynthesis and repair protein YggX
MKLTIDKTTQLPESVLDKAWAEWNTKYSAMNKVYSSNYARVARRTPFAQQFEMMLFKEGAVVQRANKKCYLQFTDLEDALIFRLKYA